MERKHDQQTRDSLVGLIGREEAKKKSDQVPLKQCVRRALYTHAERDRNMMID